MPGEEPTESWPLAGVRKMIADHMVSSKRTSAHVMTMDEVDMTMLADFRARHKERVLRDYGVKLTYMPFFVKAVTAALRNHPRLNASITDDEIILRKYYHIGIAVAREEGLIVPVVKFADTKGILQLATEIQDLYLGGRKEEAIRRVPDALVDETSLVGPREAVRDRLEAWRESGVTTLVVSTMDLATVRTMAELLL